MTVDTIIFDAGLTLLRAVPSFWRTFLDGIAEAGATIGIEPTDVPPEALRPVWETHEQAWRAAGEPSPHVGDADAETRYWSELYRRFLAHLEIDGDHHHIASLVHDRFARPGTFRPFDDVGPTLDRLDAHGVRLGLVSNWGPSLRAILADEGLLDRFETVVISGEVGVAKPDPAIFGLALDRLGVAPTRAVAYVGDSLIDDVEPSLALGLRAVLIDRWDRHDDHSGCPRVRDLTELLTVLPLPARAAS